MKVKILDTKGAQKGETELPVQFTEPVRTDLVKKAYLAIQNNSRQAYGSFDRAGMRHSVDVSKRRKDYRGSYGHGSSRISRKVLSRRGNQFFWVAAESPGTRGGRRAHPPKAEKVWAWKLNTKERRKAIRSALAATMSKELVEKRGHKLPASFPFIIADEIENIEKTKELIKTLSTLGFAADLDRAQNVSIRAGRGRNRGRTTKPKKSVLLVVTRTSKILKSAKNIPGVEVANVKRLNANVLAPGGHVGRAALFTQGAIEGIKKGLFAK